MLLSLGLSECLLKCLKQYFKRSECGRFVICGSMENEAMNRSHLESHGPSQRAMRQQVEEQDTWAQSRGNVISLARLDRFNCFKHHFNIFKKSCLFPT